MSVRRRLAKRRIDPRTELEAWRDLFADGAVMFDDDCAELELLTGIKPDANGRLPRDTAEEAWNRLGRLFLISWNHDRQPWAQQQFGEPANA
jgi:hypothetical protein